MTSAQRARPKISITVAPELLEAVDTHVRQHPELDRSKVVEDALWLWYAQQQADAMEAQFAAPRSDLEQEEHAQWRRIRTTAAERTLTRRD